MTLTMVRPLNGKIMTRHINNFFDLCRIDGKGPKEGPNNLIKSDVVLQKNMKEIKYKL